MKSFKSFIAEVKEPTGDLKKACWKGYTAVGMKMKNGRKVPNCVPVKESIEEQLEVLDEMPGANMDTRAVHSHLKKQGWKLSRTSGSHDVYTHPKSSQHIPVPRHRQLKAPLVRGILKAAKVNESAAWQRKEGKNPAGGLNSKGIASYRAEHPGSHLSMAVTTPPSKLKAGSKAANRRKSFCARMSGMEGPMKKPNGEPTRKALSLRKWNC